jgi:hypothetical protein
MIMGNRDIVIQEFMQPISVVTKSNGHLENNGREYFVNTSLNNNADAIIEEAAVMPFNQQDRLFLYADLLDEKKNKRATQKNQANLDKSNRFFGVDSTILLNRLQKYVDFQVIEQEMTQKIPNLIINKQKVLNEVITEAIHQFQAKIFMDKTEWDGILGDATLCSLGFVFHTKRHFNSKMANSKIKKVFTKIDSEIRSYVQSLPIQLPDINGSNWFDFIITPSIYGRRGKKNYGFHLLLVLKLRAVENVFYNQLATELTQLFDTYISSNHSFKGKPYGQVPRLMGMALDIRENHGDIRIESSSTPYSMHLSGIAIDINYEYNPWVKGETGLGIIKNALKYKGQPLITQANSAQKFFEELATTYTTPNLYDILKDYSNACIDYFKAKKKKSIYWGESSRNHNNGFLNLRKELAIALRDTQGLAWAAVDLGTGGMGNGDMMHFDMRTTNIGQAFRIQVGLDDRDYLTKVHRSFTRIDLQKSEKEFSYSFERNLLFREINLLNKNFELLATSKEFLIPQDRLIALRDKYTPIMKEAKKSNGTAYLTDIIFYGFHPELNNRKLTKSDTNLIEEWKNFHSVHERKNDANYLTNIVFYHLHPEVGGRKLTQSASYTGDAALIQEWKDINNQIVLPYLGKKQEDDFSIITFPKNKYFGFLSEKSFLREDDLRTIKKYQGYPLYYPKSSMVDLLMEKKNGKDTWVKVHEQAMYDETYDNGTVISVYFNEGRPYVPKVEGWIKKAWIYKIKETIPETTTKTDTTTIPSGGPSQHYLDISQLPNITALEKHNHKFITDNLFRVNVKNRDTHHIGKNVYAKQGPWAPISGYRHTIKGKVTKYFVADGHVDQDEYDWNILLENVIFQNDAYPASVVLCEVTPPDQFRDNKWFPAQSKKDEFKLEGKNICVYGPYVKDFGDHSDDDWKPFNGNGNYQNEIHPIDAIWWLNEERNNNDVTIILVQDAAKERYRKRHFYITKQEYLKSPPYPHFPDNWKPWIQYPQKEEIKIAFVYDLNVALPEFTIINIEILHSLNIYANNSMYPKITDHRLMYKFDTPFKKDNILVQVKDDKSKLKIDFTDVRRDNTGLITGYVRILADLGDPVSEEEGVLVMRIRFSKGMN